MRRIHATPTRPLMTSYNHSISVAHFIQISLLISHRESPQRPTQIPPAHVICTRNANTLYRASPSSARSLCQVHVSVTPRHAARRYPDRCASERTSRRTAQRRARTATHAKTAAPPFTHSSRRASSEPPPSAPASSSSSSSSSPLSRPSSSASGSSSSSSIPSYCSCCAAPPSSSSATGQ